MESILDIQKQKAKLILDYIANGLSEDDALTLVEWTSEEFENYKNNNLRYNQLVERKRIEYKQKLMTPITKEIEKGDAELAKWMLERQFYNDFSGKKKPENEPNNPIAIIINQIQNGTHGAALLPATRVAIKAVLPDENTQALPHSTDTSHVIDMHKKFTNSSLSVEDLEDGPSKGIVSLNF